MFFFLEKKGKRFFLRRDREGGGGGFFFFLGGGGRDVFYFQFRREGGFFRGGRREGFLGRGFFFSGEGGWVFFREGGREGFGGVKRERGGLFFFLREAGGREGFCQGERVPLSRRGGGVFSKGGKDITEGCKGSKTQSQPDQSENAGALVAAQERIDPQRRFQDCWARARMSLGNYRTLARGKETDERLAGPWVPEFWERPLPARREERCRWPAKLCGKRATNLRRPSSPPRGAKSRSRTRINVGGGSSSSLTADACCNRIKRESASSNHPRSRARCTVVPRTLRGRPHRQVRDERGRRRRRRRKRRTPKRTESNRW